MKLQNKALTLVGAFALLLFSPDPLIASERPGDHLHQAIEHDEKDLPSLTTHFEWSSRYVTEGRDNLAGGGLSSVMLETEIAGFLFGAWNAHSQGADYQEQNYFAEYGFEFLGAEFYVSYIHLQFQSDHAHDNELGAGVALPDAFFGLTPAFDWYCSLEADGSFFEFSLSRECEITDRIVLAPSVTFGANDGYIADGHNGANHLVFQLTATCQITDAIALEAYLAQSFAIDENPALFADDGSLGDLFYGGVALSIEF